MTESDARLGGCVSWSGAGHDTAVHGRAGLGYMFSKGVKYSMLSGSGVGLG